MKKQFITAITIGLASLASAQDFHHTLFQMAPLTLNPGTIGNFTGDMRLVSNYRTQWGSVSTPFKTISASAEYPMLGPEGKKVDYFTIAASFVTDKAGSGVMKATQYNAGFSYNKSFDGRGATNFSVGFLAGATQRSINLGGSSWDSQFNGLAYDPALPTGEVAAFGDSYFIIDASTGVAYTNSRNDRFRYAIGGAALHLLRPRIDFFGGKDKQYRKGVAHASFQIALGDNSNAYFVPVILYSRQGPAQLIDIGLGVKYNLQERSRYTDFQNSQSFTIGGAYRVGDAVSAYVRFDMGQLGAAFTYDFNLSGLTPASKGRGALEASIVYTGIFRNKNTRLDRPNFF